MKISCVENLKFNTGASVLFGLDELKCPSNWTTGIRGNFSSFVCMVPVSGVTFTVTGPKGINAPKISYVIFQEWA